MHKLTHIEIKMKRLSIALYLIAATLFTACSGNKKADANGTVNDSITAKKDSVPLYVEEEDKTDYSKFAAQPTRIDTTIGDWEIHIREFYDGRKVKVDKLTIGDYSVKVNIFKGGKPVFKNYKLNSKAVAGANYFKDFILTIGEEVFVTETTVYLPLSFGEPETCNHSKYNLAFCADGQVRKFRTSVESDEGDMDEYVFDVYNLYTMYVNELTQAKPNAAAIQKVLNKYCTKAFAQKLQGKTIKNNPLLCPGKFEYKWLSSFAVHSKEEGSTSCIVNFEMPGVKKVYKRLQVQPKPKSDYEYIVGGVSEATESDIPVIDYGEMCRGGEEEE